MHPHLADAIQLFRHDQELALDYIHGKLGIPVPRTAFLWAMNAQQQLTTASAIATAEGVTLYVHGAGIEVTHPDFHIDYDYGPDGQCDCFDTWRLSLHRHIRLGLPNPVDDPRPLDAWLRDAVDAGELICVANSFSMFYDPSLSSKWSPPTENVR
jgi:hypothetical protein